jgi:fibronectin-binding autotransporter adhesin
MKLSRLNFRNRFLHAALASTLAHAATAGTLYWDVNGTAPGSGNAGGLWNFGTNWSADPTGESATQAWVDGDSAVFSAGSDGTASIAVSFIDTITTPSIQLKDTGLVSLTGGAIDITGGSTFDTSALGSVTGRQLTWLTPVIGNGPLTLAAHGSTSDTGDGSNSFFILGGANSFTGDVTITTGILRADSNFGPLTNTVILNGGGIVDPNLNLNFPYNLRIDEGRTGTYRTWGSVATGQASGALLGGGTLRHTDGGTLTFSGDGSAFTGTIDNARGTVATTTNNWSGTHFLNADGAALRFNAPGTTTIRSYAGDRDVFVPAGSRLNVASGTLTAFAGAAAQASTIGPSASGGSITSSSGTLTLDAAISYLNNGNQAISILVEDFDASTPLKLVKNGPGGLTAFNKPNTHSGGTEINDGRVAVQNNQAFGTGTVTIDAFDEVFGAGQAWLNLGGIVVPNPFTIAGRGPEEPSGRLGAIRFDNNTTISGPITVTAEARLVAWNGAVGNLTGPISGSSDLQVNFFENVTANGTVNLTGDLSAFTGKLVVSKGRANVPSGIVGGGLFVDDGATISGKPSFAGNATFGFAGGARILFDATTPGALHTQGNLELVGTTTVVATPPIFGNVTIMSYGGTLIGNQSNLEFTGLSPAARPGSGFDLSESGKIKLNIASANLTWTGAQGSAWNFDDLNWLNGATPDKFFDFDIANFGETLPASFTTTLNSDNNDLVFTAVPLGAAGEAISIEYFDSFAPNTPFSVNVTDNAIRITIAVDGANNLTTTAAEIKAAIEASPAAAALVTVSLASGNDGSGFVNAFPETNLARKGTLTIPANISVSPQLTRFDHSAPIGYHLSGPGTLTNTPIVKKGSGTLLIGHPTVYTDAIAIITGTSSINLEQGTLAFSSRTALATGTPITFGSTNSGNSDTVLEVPRASAGDQLVLSAAFTLGTLAPGSTSQAIIRYTGVSNGSTTTNGAPTIQGSLNLNGRDLYLENSSNTAGGTTRLWNFQPAISGTGNVRVRTGANPDGTLTGAPRVRIQSTANNWNGNLFLERGELQIGFTGQVIPDNCLAIFSAGSRLSMGNTAETIRGITGGAVSGTIPSSDIASNTGSANTVRLTLTDTNADNTHVYDGRITNGSPGFMAITKAGVATQVLNGPCTHTGTTLVTGGRLIVNHTFTSAITVSAGATLGGTMTSTAAVTATAAAARISPGYPVGTLTAASANLSTGGILDIDINGASNDKIVTTGVLNITSTRLNITSTGVLPAVIVIATHGTRTGTFATTTGIPAGYELVYDYNDGVSSNHIALVGPATDPYLAWLNSFPAITGPNRAPDADFDNDGVPNGIEFVLGSDPTSAASTGLFTNTVADGNLVLTFKRSDASKAFPVTVEHGTSLATWPGQILVPTIPTVSERITVADHESDLDDITVRIPMGSDLRKFARIRAEIPFPP